MVLIIVDLVIGVSTNLVLKQYTFDLPPSHPLSLSLHVLINWMASLDWIGAGSSPRLLDWDTVQHKLPWNVVILLGSGFALAEGAQVWFVCVLLNEKQCGLLEALIQHSYKYMYI